MSSVCPVLCLLLLVVSCLVSVDTRNPGLQARVTADGLNYANKVAIASLSGYMRKASIPDQSGKSGGFKWEVKNMRVTSFTSPVSSLKVNPGKGLSWTGQNAGLDLHGDFHYKKWFIKSSGSFDCTISRLSFSIGMDFGVDARGRPSIRAGTCSSDIGSLSVKFHGGGAWFYNLFRGYVSRKLKDSLKGQLCKLINSQINGEAEKKLATLPVLTKLGKYFLLDYRLISGPEFTKGYLETRHKGEIIWAARNTTADPVVSPPLQEVPGTGNMFYVWMSDYLFNTAGFVAQQNKFLNYNLTSKDLPAKQRSALNTTCSTLVCIGHLIPQLGHAYPNRTVALDMVSTVAPKMTISKKGISVQCAGRIEMYAVPTPSQPQAFLLTLNATMTATVTANITNEIMYGKMDSMKVEVGVLKSAVGKVEPEALQFVINEALKYVLIQKINGLGAKGFPLPVTKEIKFEKTTLILAENALVIATDLRYKSITDTGLKFEPLGNVRQLSTERNNAIFL